MGFGRLTTQHFRGHLPHQHARRDKRLLVTAQGNLELELAMSGPWVVTLDHSEGVDLPYDGPALAICRGWGSVLDFLLVRMGICGENGDYKRE